LGVVTLLCSVCLHSYVGCGYTVCRVCVHGYVGCGYTVM
jgi:hypothetical protein